MNVTAISASRPCELRCKFSLGYRLRKQTKTNRQVKLKFVLLSKTLQSEFNQDHKKPSGNLGPSVFQVKPAGALGV